MWDMYGGVAIARLGSPASFLTSSRRTRERYSPTPPPPLGLLPPSEAMASATPQTPRAPVMGLGCWPERPTGLSSMWERAHPWCLLLPRADDVVHTVIAVYDPDGLSWEREHHWLPSPVLMSEVVVRGSCWGRREERELHWLPSPVLMSVVVVRRSCWGRRGERELHWHPSFVLLSVVVVRGSC
jgi:hypothetical protein